MSKTLYVGNLPWSLREEDLKRIFAVHVPIRSVRIITDRDTGRSRGFGFVEVNDEYATRAIASVHGYVLAGRPLIVNEAQPRLVGPRRV
ncbi:MAG: RNA recognition motif domain-containing protein [Mycobacterium leprae]